MHLTFEENPKKFLDSQVIIKNNIISTQVITKLKRFLSIEIPNPN